MHVFLMIPFNVNTVPDKEMWLGRAQDFVCVEIVKVCTIPTNTHVHYFTVIDPSKDFLQTRRDEQKCNYHAA